MRTWNTFLILVIASASLAPGARRPGHTWAIVSSSGLDPRVKRQVEEFAARDQALVRYFRTPQEAARFRVPRGGLTLELREEKDLEAWTSELRLLCGSNARGLTTELAREGYELSVTYPSGLTPERVRLTAATPAGFHHGLRRIPVLLRLTPDELAAKLTPPAKATFIANIGRLATVTLADFPSFRERGIVEGFYGAPWTHQDRIAMLRFEGRHGMNVYYYAPKDDPYHRKLWPEPYPPQEMKRLGELVSAARTNFVDFCFAISPGLTMAYSSETDFAKLAAKLANVGSMGVSCFALFLDDVPQDLQHPEDRARFKTLAAAHGALINRLYNHLQSESKANRLVVTPTTYTNAWGDRDYIRELGSAVNSAVPIVWTGPDVASPAITADQAREWGGYLKRPPLIWDNFPVNDGRAWRVHLGPLRARDPDLTAVSQGLFSNPMNQPRASMLPLETVADYLWNSVAYDPSRALREAINEQYGKDGERLLESFLKTYGDYWWDENIFTPLFSSRRKPIDIPAIERRLKQLDGALRPLRSRGAFQKLATELAPLLTRTRERLARVDADPAFKRLPDGKLERRADFDRLTAARAASPPALDGDFAKWLSGTVHVLNTESQILVGASHWKDPEDLSARVACSWDDSHLYIGVDMTDKNLYQPHSGRGIENGDVFVLTLETGFRKNYFATTPTGDEYRLYFSPGNFTDVPPSIFPDDDYLPPHTRPHDHNAEIKTAWKKTLKGYSGDIAIPASYFDGERFSAGYEIGFSFAAQKVLPGSAPSGIEQDFPRIILGSTADRLFPVELDNPASYPRLTLINKP